jgi:hypothetical protein
MAGLKVSRALLDQKSSDAILAIRDAFRKVETLSEYLSTVPSDAPEGDLLVKTMEEGGFGYTADEAYLIRYVFQMLNDLNVQPALESGRKLTGLE